MPEYYLTNDGSNERTVLLKYGGNAMTRPELVAAVLEAVRDYHQSGVRIVIVHGGGPYIQKMLDALGIESEFIGGHRRTDDETIRYVGMVLSGQVNGEVVSRLNVLGVRAVGVCGRDARLASVVPRKHTGEEAEPGDEIDLGYVGDVDRIRPRLLHDLLRLGYLPVVAPISTGPEGRDYNVNADMFAGHVAVALEVDDYILLTDVDGLYLDKDDPASLISSLSPDEASSLMGSVIAGGMIPKVTSCVQAVAEGVPRAVIANGTKADSIRAALAGDPVGTVIKE
jgi:acetylglutamate kinase